MENVKIEQIHLSASTVANMVKLPQYMIDYLWECIDVAKKEKNDTKDVLAGQISHSYTLKDPRNLITKDLMDILMDPQSPTMKNIQSEIDKNFCRFSNPEDFKLEPHLNGLWVNFQKKCEFQPIHNHTGQFSFVIWMDIPYHWKDEAKLPFVRSNNEIPPGGNFSFVQCDNKSRSTYDYIIQLSPSKNGYCCFFPSDLSHQVYPFYTSDKERISISGNIVFEIVGAPKQRSQQFPFLISNT
jgi:hypothetical protein